MQQLTLIDHLNELRSRLFKLAVVFVTASSVGYMGHESIMHLLIKPLGDKLVYTSPGGGFTFTLNIILLVGLVITIPFILHELLRFIEPALTKKAQISTFKVMAISSMLALCGVLFAYFLTMPPALEFLKGFSNSDIQALISTDSYMSFVGVYLGGFAILFQIPLLLWVINRITPLSPRKLLGYQKYVVLAAFIIAAILTPTPDPMNQTAMAVPIVVLYQMGVGVVWASTRKVSPAQTQMFAFKQVQPVPISVVEPLSVALRSTNSAQVNRPDTMQLNIKTSSQQRVSQRPAINRAHRVM